MKAEIKTQYIPDLGEKLESILEKGYETSLPTNADWGYAFRLKMQKNTFDIVVYENSKTENKIEIANYLMTTRHSRKLVPYDKEDVFKEKSLINKKNSIITEYWEVNSGLLLTTEEKKIVDNLQLNDD